ncbi:DNA-3-methyladenine glycosylase 2 family protein [Pelagibius litoralis]|uniref:DNA-3-methyladenine glycosylase II n=1 Tax=Pelagibius litoralis TaxID=374515 RepID=A0A967F104_9PROT|nr:DNA-3-methyladenine glycosylase 2 family protein [Pelagibius litoralis]NIA71141.1 DNA-3-methyladenine glycosylase 2 family protein [Pelagibius litoralis]
MIPKPIPKPARPEEVQGPVPDERLRPAMEVLARQDPDMAKAYKRCGLPPERSSEPGFAGLIRMIAGQQVSVQSARAIVTRLEERAMPLTAERFLLLGEDDLKAVGFSRPKMRYGRILAEEIAGGGLDIDGLAALDDAAAIAALTRIKGIGPWTAEIYLLFALGRPDILPVDDLALCVAAQHLKGLAERPDRKAMLTLGEPWRPFRSAAARFLWHLYRHPGVALGQGDGTLASQTARARKASTKRP